MNYDKIGNDYYLWDFSFQNISTIFHLISPLIKPILHVIFKTYLLVKYYRTAFEVFGHLTISRNHLFLTKRKINLTCCQCFILFLRPSCHAGRRGKRWSPHHACGHRW